MIKLLAVRRDGTKVLIRAHEYNQNFINLMNSRLRSGEIVDYEILA